MLDTTIQAVKAILKADPSVTPDAIKDILAFAQSEPHEPMKQLSVHMSEAAKLLGVNIRTVDRLVKSGHLTPCYLPGRERCFGVTYESLEKLITTRKVVK